MSAVKRRHEFIWTLRNAYADLKRMRSLFAVLLSMGFTVMLFWFFFSLEPFLTLVNQWFAHFLLSGPAPEEVTLAEAASQTVLAFLLLVGLFVWLYFRYREARPSKIYTNEVSPEPHEGLIFLLSPYKPRSSEVAAQLGVPLDVEALRALLEREEEGARADLRQKIFATSWGPLYAAVQHHREVLRHCWLVSTEGDRGSRAQAEVAVRLVQVAATLRPVECHYEDYSIQDVNDITEIVRVINRIYTKALPLLELKEDQVIADLTGGTALMSAAMALVTIDRPRKIEYLRQDKLILKKDGGFSPRSPDEIREESVLMMVETWRDLVPRREEEA